MTAIPEIIADPFARPTPTAPELPEPLAMYVRHGWPIFPVHSVTAGRCSCDNPECDSIGKHPRTEHGFKNATADPRMIAAWLRKWPNTNWGLDCGAAKVQTVDIDGQVGAGHWDEILAEENYPTVETPIAVTGGGGRHILFALNGHNVTRKEIAPEVHLKGAGGYIVLAPSVHLSGRAYEWLLSPDDVALQPIPDWLLDRMTHGADAVVLAKPVDGIIPDGQRNSTLASLAGSMRRRGFTDASILAALTEENAARCVPPLDRSELEAIAFSIGKYPATADLSDTLRVGADADNANLFVADHGENLRWCDPLKSWLVWDDKRWARDDNLGVMRRAEGTARGLLEAAARATPERAQVLSKAGAALLFQSRMTAMVDAAKRKVSVHQSQLDNDRGLLTCANGVVNLRTGELLPFDKGRYSTRMTDVVYDPKARCPKWIDFLRLVMAGDTDTINWLGRAVGYTLTGFSDAKMFAFLYGAGNNGKTTFLETLRMVFGDYAQKTSVEALLLARNRDQKNTPYTARMQGARFVYADEMPEGSRLNTSLIKDLTGGDTLTAMAKYQAPEEFRPSHFLWAYGNTKPTVGDASDAMWSRLKLIRFGVTIPADMRLPMAQVLDGFREELPGILAWAVTGAMIAIEEGVGTTEQIKADTKDYQQAEDIVGNFLADRCSLHPEYRCAKKAAYEAFKLWAEEEGIRAFGTKTLTNRLRADFDVVLGGHADKEYIGMRLEPVT